MSARLKCLLLLACFCLNASGATYYVRTDGSDSNAGTSNTSGGAWRTIQKAANTITAGDTAYVQAGAYGETVTVNSGDGSSGNYKRFVGEGLPSTSKIVLQDAYCWVEGMVVSNMTLNATGVQLKAASGNSVLTNNWITTGGVGIEVDQTAGIDSLSIVGNLVSNCNKGLILYGVAGGSGHDVRSNTVYRLNQHGSANDCDYLRLMSGANHRVVGNYFYGSNTNDINTAISSYPHVDGIQVFAESGNAACTNALIMGNVMLDAMSSIQFTDTLGLGHGGWTIVSNVFGRGIAIHYASKPNGDAIVNMDDATGTTTFRRNSCIKITAAAIFFDCNSVDLAENVFVDCGTAYSFTGTTPGTGSRNVTHPNSSPDAGTGDTTSDPVVMSESDIVGADGVPWTSDDGLRLQSSSPAIDMAADGRSEPGAYQFGRRATVTTLNVTRIRPNQ